MKALGKKREKIFGHDYAVPLDGNAKARIEVYAYAWSARQRRKGQPLGPLTRCFRRVLDALLWVFHNCKNGMCYPTYETIAKHAECQRDTVCEAIKILEQACVLGWVNRVVRKIYAVRDAAGHVTHITKLDSTSNGYFFYDPKPKNPAETLGKNFPTQTTIDSIYSSSKPEIRPLNQESPLEKALSLLKAAMDASKLAKDRRQDMVKT